MPNTRRTRSPENAGAGVVGVCAFSPVPVARPFRPAGVQAGSLRGLKLVPAKRRCLGLAYHRVPREDRMGRATHR
jgi:hypothetical protein